MGFMATLGDRILEAIRYTPLDDDVLAKRLGIPHRQAVNQTARRLEAQGLLRRIPGPDGKIVNALPAQATPDPTSTAQPSADAASIARRVAPVPSPSRARFVGDRITEDEVKEAVRAYLVADGFVVDVAWGRSPGIDIVARHGDGRRYVVEAKAEVGIAGAQQHNYFVGMLGELVQRMDDPEATYAIALPDNRQYRGLVNRLPDLAKKRMSLAVFWVDRTAGGLTVVEEPRPV
jgi:hemin uptake protein HemP